MSTPSPRKSNLRRPHPLAVELAERLRATPHARVLDLGAGRGRNVAALEAAGYDVCAIPDDRVQEFRVDGRFDGALSTHALLHGTPDTIASLLAALAEVLKPGAPLYAAFGSKADARYGKGIRIAGDAFAPDSGEEQGVAHSYFDEPTLRAAIERAFAVETIEERAVDDVVGAWAHAQRPQGTVHWFVRARRL